MKKYLKSALFVVISLNIQAKAPKVDVKKEFEFAEKQYQLMLKSHPDYNKFPQSTKPDGTPDDRKSSWWCSGFFGGSLWYLYEFSNKPEWKEAAHNWTMAVEREKTNTRTHDLGFMLYCPFGNGYRLTKNPKYKEVMLEGAKSLSTRFNAKTGVIKSWNTYTDRQGAKHYFPVIIDNMMNLEFLFWASKESKDKTYANLSISHADKTMQNHFRPDYSSYHVVDYDTATGKVVGKVTAQGFSDSSAWARGQTWGLYGYVVMYRETKDKKYLVVP